MSRAPRKSGRVFTLDIPAFVARGFVSSRTSFYQLQAPNICRQHKRDHGVDALCERKANDFLIDYVDYSGEGIWS